MTEKKQKDKKKFPKIYRFITEKDFLRHLVIGLASSFVLIAVFLVVLDAHKNYRIKTQIDEEKTKIVQEIKFWESFVDKYKGYRDGYYRLAVLEYRLKDFEKAKYYLQKTLSLDPNFEEARKFENMLKVN